MKSIYDEYTEEDIRNKAAEVGYLMTASISPMKIGHKFSGIGQTFVVIAKSNKSAFAEWHDLMFPGFEVPPRLKYFYEVHTD